MPVCLKLISSDKTKSTLKCIKPFEELIQIAQKAFKENVSKFYCQSELVHIQSQHDLDKIIQKHFNDKEIILISILEDEEVEQHHMHVWNKDLIIKFKQAHMVDLCFLANLSSTMQGFLKELLILQPIIEKILTGYKDLKLRVAFIGYAENNDEVQFIDFTDDLEKFKSLLENEIYINDAKCKNVMSGLTFVSKLSWKYRSRILFHLCNVPNNDEDEEDEIFEVLESVQKLDIDYFFAKISDNSLNMINQLNNALSKLSHRRLKVLDNAYGIYTENNIKNAIVHMIETNKKKVFFGNFDSNEIIWQPVNRKCTYYTEPSDSFLECNSICVTFEFKSTLDVFKNTLLVLSNERRELNSEIIDQFIRSKSRHLKIFRAVEPFDIGSIRYAYIGFIQRRDGSFAKCVLKKLISNSNAFKSFNFFKNMLQTQTVAKYLIQEFQERVLNEKTLIFLNQALVYIEQSNEYFTIEKFIDGEFTKLNSNKGCVNDDVYSQNLNAFSHWTYEITNGYLIVDGLQGLQVKNSKERLLTHSTISSIEQQFSVTDLGELGIVDFFDTHHCNSICNTFTSECSPSRRIDSKIDDTNLLINKTPESFLFNFHDFDFNSF